MLIHVILLLMFNEIIPEEACFKGENVSRFFCFLTSLSSWKENSKCSQIMSISSQKKSFSAIAFNVTLKHFYKVN